MHNQQRSTFYLNRGGKPPENTKEYKSTLPEGMTQENLREAYGKVVWCKFVDCRYNTQIEGLQRTTGDITNNSSFKPISEKEHIWDSICVRNEIALEFIVITSQNVKHKIPACFVASSDSRNKMDWSKLLQSDGTPYGGNIESQNPDHAAFSDGGWGSWDSPDDQGSYDGDQPEAPLDTGGSGLFDA
jgi:hypothetical protein